MKTYIAAIALIPMCAAALSVGCEGRERAESGEATVDTVALAPKNNSGITGSVIVNESADSTTITVILKGGVPGNTHPTHIHHGTCAEPGAVLQPLTSVTIGADSTGTSTTTVATKTLEDAEDSGPLLVQTHQPGGVPAACGAIKP